MMKTSELVKLADGNQKIMDDLFELRGGMNKALSEFRSSVKAPAKNGSVNYGYGKKHVQYTYVTLDDLIASIDKAIKNLDISWDQTSNIEPAIVVKTKNYKGQIEQHKEQVERVTVATVLRCNNGWNETLAKVSQYSDSMDPQDVGSAITYAKRYSLATAFGINSDEDDDNRHDQHQRVRSYPNDHDAPKKMIRSNKPTDKQVGFIKGLLKQTKSDGTNPYQYLYSNRDNLASNLTYATASRSIKYLIGLKKKQRQQAKNDAKKPSKSHGAKQTTLLK